MKPSTLADIRRLIRRPFFLLAAGVTLTCHAAGNPEDLKKLHAAATAGDTATFGALLDSGVDLYEPDGIGNSVAYYAARANHWEIVELMFTRGYDPVALRQGHPQGNAVYQRGLEILPQAARHGRLDWVRRLLKAGVDIDVPKASAHEKEDPLCQALLYKHNDVARFLLAEECPLTYQAELGGWDGPGGPNEKYSDAGVLHLAILNRDLDMLNTLLRAGAKIDWKNSRGITPLMLAADQDWAEGVTTLIGSGASLAGKDVTGKDLAAYAEPHPAVRKAIVLGELGPSPTSELSPVAQFLLAISADDRAAAAKLLETVEGLTVANGPNDAPLILLAAKAGRTEIVSLLIKFHADPNRPDLAGDTALYEAVVNRHPETARVLLEAGADPNLYAPEGWAPLERAIKLQQFEVAKLMLEKGASPDLDGDHHSWRGPPICHAAQTGNLAMVQALVAKGANIHALDSDGFSAIVYACDPSGTPEVVEFLVTHGMDINWVGPSGDTPLAKAVAFCRPAVVQKVLELGAKPVPLSVALHKLQRERWKNFAEISALLKAAGMVTEDDHFWMGHPTREQILKFVSEGGSPNYDGGESPLFRALYAGDFDLARFLLDHHANPNASGYVHPSPMFALAVGAGAGGEDAAVEVGRRMLELGADPNGNRAKESASYFGPQPPLTSAVSGGHSKLVELLLAAGADPAPGLQYLEKSGQALAPDIQVKIRRLLEKSWPKPTRL